MIRYLKNEEIDKDKWDACIRESSNSLVYAYSWYLSVLCPGQWDALIEDDYQIVFPLPRRRKAGISYVYTPFFIQQLGAFSRIPVEEEKVNEFIAAISGKFRLIELNLNTHNHASIDGYSFLSNQNYELSLGQSHEQICSNYSNNLVRNLRRASNYKLLLKQDENPEAVIQLFRSEKGKEIKHWGDREYSVFVELLAECKQREFLEVWGAYSDKGTFIAGVIFLRTEKRVIFLFSATSTDAKESGAMAWIVDRFIEKNSDKKLILDFEGSNDHGLARFYSGFGASQIHYQSIMRNTLPVWINFLRQLNN